MQDTEGGAAWFYNQNGPNYSEGGAPGDFQGIKNLTIVENFDTDNYGPVGNTNSANTGDTKKSAANADNIVCLIFIFPSHFCQLTY